MTGPLQFTLPVFALILSSVTLYMDAPFYCFFWLFSASSVLLLLPILLYFLLLDFYYYNEKKLIRHTVSHNFLYHLVFATFCYNFAWKIVFDIFYIQNKKIVLLFFQMSFSIYLQYLQSTTYRAFFTVWF